MASSPGGAVGIAGKPNPGGYKAMVSIAEVEFRRAKKRPPLFLVGSSNWARDTDGSHHWIPRGQYSSLLNNAPKVSNFAFFESNFVFVNISEQ